MFSLCLQCPLKSDYTKNMVSTQSRPFNEMCCLRLNFLFESNLLVSVIFIAVFSKTLFPFNRRGALTLVLPLFKRETTTTYLLWVVVRPIHFLVIIGCIDHKLTLRSPTHSSASCQIMFK